MLKTILIVLAVAILALLAYAATRPDSFRVERSTTIKAPPEKIYAHLQDFNRWVAWSPWEKMDTAMKTTYGGAATGKGATYAWSSDKVGAGSMEILDTTIATGNGLVFIDELEQMPSRTTPLSPSPKRSCLRRSAARRTRSASRPRSTT